MNFDSEPSVANLLEVIPPEAGAVGLDLEADSLYRYAERICLVQVCYAQEVVLLDPFGEDSLQPFIEWLKTATIWMHGADYDMSLMLREYGFVPPVLFDTQIAAQLLGHQKFGYASLVEEYFGVELSKSSQKADWGQRPLSNKMLEYARNDVRYLLPLAEKLETKLKEKQRYEWFLESCQASQKRVIKREGEEKEHWRIGGSGKLRPRGLAFLKALWQWRDAEAAEWNKPSFMVTTNKVLLTWAEQLAAEQQITFPPRMRSNRVGRLKDAIEAASELKEVDWPQRPKRERYPKDETFEERLKVALEARNAVAENLEIDPSLIASRPVMEQMIGHRAAPEEILLNWQRSVLEM